MSPDEQYVAMGSADNRVYVWDARGKEVVPGGLKGHAQPVGGEAIKVAISLVFWQLSSMNFIPFFSRAGVGVRMELRGGAAGIQRQGGDDHALGVMVMLWE